MTWPTDSPRRRSLPDDWPVIRRRILSRDGHRCTWVEGGYGRCVHPATDVDHIDGSNNHADSNLRSLCEPHHDRRTAQQANDARWSKGRMARPTEPHPGLI